MRGLFEEFENINYGKPELRIVAKVLPDRLMELLSQRRVLACRLTQHTEFNVRSGTIRQRGASKFNLTVYDEGEEGDYAVELPSGRVVIEKRFFEASFRLRADGREETVGEKPANGQPRDL